MSVETFQSLASSKISIWNSIFHERYVCSVIVNFRYVSHWVCLQRNCYFICYKLWRTDIIWASPDNTASTATYRLNNLCFLLYSCHACQKRYTYFFSARILEEVNKRCSDFVGVCRWCRSWLWLCVVVENWSNSKCSKTITGALDKMQIMYL